MRFAVLVAIEKCLSRHLPSIKWACRWTVARSYANLLALLSLETMTWHQAYILNALYVHILLAFFPSSPCGCLLLDCFLDPRLGF